MSLKIAGLLCASLLIAAMPARADTDYRCLNLCVNSGTPGPICMTQCTYNKPAQPLTPLTSATPPVSDAGVDYLSKTRILPTLSPLAEKELLAEKQNAPQTHEKKDYVCVNACLQQKMQYDTCNEQCTTEVTENGQILTPQTDKSVVTGTFQPGLKPGTTPANMLDPQNFPTR